MTPISVNKQLQFFFSRRSKIIQNPGRNFPFWGEFLGVKVLRHVKESRITIGQTASFEV
jgi:hypothetical protein